MYLWDQWHQTNIHWFSIVTVAPTVFLKKKTYTVYFSAYNIYISSAKVVGSIPREHIYWQYMYSLNAL